MRSNFSKKPTRHNKNRTRSNQGSKRALAKLDNKSVYECQLIIALASHVEEIG